MQPDKLLSMANQIASFFQSYPEEEAVAGIHHHIEAFWTPTMARTLREHLAHDRAGAEPLVVSAVCRGSTAQTPVMDVLTPGPDDGPLVSDGA